ncbi:MAG: SdrD B-like domain-containing protein [Chloroflexota bacterium]|jgi:hypothetical protein
METRRQADRKMLARYAAILVIVTAVVIGILMVGNRPTGNVFPNLSSVTCGYNFKVIAFADANSDGIQNADEAGIGGVAVTLQHSKPKTNSTPEQKQTDSSGLAHIFMEDYCPEHDTLVVNAKPPDGYRATTAVSFGPYPVSEMTDQSETEVAQNPMPEVLYVGLRQS